MFGEASVSWCPFCDTKVRCGIHIISSPISCGEHLMFSDNRLLWGQQANARRRCTFSRVCLGCLSIQALLGAVGVVI